LSLLSCLFLVLTLMSCSAASPEKKMQEAKMMAKKKQNKKKFVSTIIGKKKSIKNKRAVLNSAESPKENYEGKMMASTQDSITRGLWFGIGSLINQKILNKKKFVSAIIVNKRVARADKHKMRRSSLVHCCHLVA